jgi:iron complex outermembrane receptor protein
LAKDAKNYSSSLVAAYVQGAGTSRNATMTQLNANHLHTFGKNISVAGKMSFWNNKLVGGAQMNWTGKNRLGQHHIAGGSFYRLPTINELYWTPGGNPDLNSERSFGAKYSLLRKWNAISLYVSSDQLFFTNLIQWTPGANGFWSPENIEQAYTSTSSLIGSYSNGNWFNEVSFTHQYSRVISSVVPGNEGKSLLYRPDFNAVYTVTYDAGRFNAQIRTHYLGKRQTLRDNSPLGTIPSELWMDFSLTTKVLTKVRLLATLHNITGARRNFFLNYPMPGRYLSLTLQLNSKS